jgi:citrate lyase subunit beta/citryl-CoA lyase
MMFVPSNVPRFVEKAHERGADAVVLDLEDSIPPDKKEEARPMMRDAVPFVGRGGADVMVRINHPFEMAVRDLDYAVTPGVVGVIYPKTESARDIAIVDALIAERELAVGLPVGTVGMLLLVETARGVLNVREISEECERVERVFGIAYGAEDATEEMGVETTPEGWERFFGNAVSVQAAVAAGIQAYGRLGSAFDYKNLEPYEDSLRRSAQFGFKGALCIHPAQVEPLNRAFSPPSEQVGRARRTIEIMREALAQGRASASLDGRMIDIPTLRRAERILERVRAIEEKEKRKKAVIPSGAP